MSTAAPLYVFRAVTARGDAYELNSLDTPSYDLAHDRANRASRLIARLGDPLLWEGGKVVVTERAGYDDCEVSFVYRVPSRKAVTHAG